MPPIHFAHANGFPAKTYTCFLDQFSGYDLSYVPVLGHDGQPITRGYTGMCREVAQSIERHHREPVVGMGHSMGAVIMYYLAQRRPELFDAIIMIEPPIFHPWKRGLLNVIEAVGLAPRVFPPARKAARRRRRFDSREQAYAYWRHKRLFQPFDEACFQHYIDHGLRETSGGKLELVFSPEIERKAFCTILYRLGKRKLQVPSYFVYGTRSDVLQPEDIRANRRLLPETRFVAFEGGHMFPLEAPQAAARQILDLLASP